ncbi:Glycogen operon protein GlgX [Pseudoclavibacter triregionum]|nr:Glycogen operon protein GlgX [Pseudoclavibacter triregionum]
MLPFAPHADLGLTSTPDGPRLRVVSRHASAMELCFVNQYGRVDGAIPMARDPRDRDVWEIVCPLLAPGTRYGLRVDGPQSSRGGFDPDRLLLDPYARHVENVGTEAEPVWCGIVRAEEAFDWGGVEPPRRPLRDVVVYEAHVKGLTKLAPFVPEGLRGTYAGLADPDVIAHLVDLGVTAVELLPIHAISTERFLRRQGLTNYWGYSTVGFFSPHAPYASPAARAAGPEAVARELKGMVRLLHEAGIEVYLDVVYNHTAEQGVDGHTSSFRGIDNELYYRFDEHDRYLDVTGCGNSLDASEPVVQQLILDSLAHWVEEYRIDGFRFDLAATLGRTIDGSYSSHHPLLKRIAADPRLEHAKLIAEPWDVGMGGWQTGHFPHGWSEWNDWYRDRMRDFWIRDIAEARHTGVPPQGPGGFATALAGSSNLFADERGPLASVNFVTAHDGFTLRDLVSYNAKHNLLNAELGRDGTSDNRSYNFGIEGPSKDPDIEASRRLAMRNLLGALCLSAGVPMITAGDEFARSQNGNNNPYNQDSELTWMSWDHTPEQKAQRDHLSRLLEIRRAHPTLRPTAFNHGTRVIEHGSRFEWFDALGRPMTAHEWNSPAGRTVQYVSSSFVPVEPDAEVEERHVRPRGRTPEDLGLMLGELGPSGAPDGYRLDRVLVVVHGTEEAAIVRPPELPGVAHYTLLWDSTAETVDELSADAAGAHVIPLTSHRITGPSLRIYRANPEAGP